MKAAMILSACLLSIGLFAQTAPPAPLATGTRAIWKHEGKDTSGKVRLADGFFLYYRQGTVTKKIDITNPATLLVGTDYIKDLLSIPEIANKENCLAVSAYYTNSTSKLESKKSNEICALIIGKPTDPKDLRIVD